MTHERTIPILPCRHLEDVLPFYEALGFEVTYRQARPNPYAVVRRGEIELHFGAIDGFRAEDSYGSVVVLLRDADLAYRSFADGLRAAYGRLPSAGIPRLLRPRKKLGTVAGFSVVDPGGNWIRISRIGDTEQSTERAKGLALVLHSAARIGDAKGDDATAAQMIDSGLVRYPEASPRERLSALVYRAELAVRMGNSDDARSALAAIKELELDADEGGQAAADLAAAAEIERDLA